MKSKRKIVATGLVLLTFAGLMMIAGCKTDVDMDSTRQEQAGGNEDGGDSAQGLTAAEAIAKIKSLSSEGHHPIKVRGTPSVEELVNLSASISKLASGVMVELDLSNVAGLKEIPNDSFMGCQNLSAITFPNGLQSIGMDSFRNCSGLVSVTIPSSVRGIHKNAFRQCTGLVNVTFSDGSQLGYIGENAFRQCSSLEKIAIPASVTTIDGDAFRDCTSLSAASVTVEDTSSDWILVSSSTSEKISASEVVSTILNTDQVCKFAGTAAPAILGLTGTEETIKVTDEDSLGAIRWALEQVPGVQVTLDLSGTSIVAIPEGCFRNCNNLVGVRLPDTLQVIYSNAFQCTKLSQITLPSGVSNVEDFAFAGCPITFSVQNGTTYDVMHDGYLLVKRETKALVACSALATSVSIPAGIETITQGAFSYCNLLESVTIPGGVTKRENNAFGNCTSLKSITFVDPKNWYSDEMYTTSIDSAALDGLKTNPSPMVDGDLAWGTIYKKTS